jgi:hypothetical protein
LSARWYSQPVSERLRIAVISGTLLLSASGVVLTSIYVLPPLFFVAVVAATGTLMALLERRMPRSAGLRILSAVPVAILAAISRDVFYGERAAETVVQWQVGLVLLPGFLVPFMLIVRPLSGTDPHSAAEPGVGADVGPR